MRWVGRRQSDNIEDRRGDGGGFPGGFGRSSGRMPIGFPSGSGARTGGGIGIGGIIVIIIIAWVFGINPLALLGGGGSDSSIVVGPGSSGGSATTGKTGTPSDEGAEKVAFVLADTEDTWAKLFQASGMRYQVPTLVLFSGQTRSACGFASAAVGPFYCPGDQKVYIDLSFYDQLSRQFKAPGDMAEAYVIAHEIGHHVQNLVGILPKVDAARRNTGEAQANQLSVRLELQADCLAGVWANAANQEGVLEPGDIDEALNAASQIGDDTLQRRSQGMVVPDSFTHGSAEQRSRWFKRGYQTGAKSIEDAAQICDTFGASQV